MNRWLVRFYINCNCYDPNRFYINCNCYDPNCDCHENITITAHKVVIDENDSSVCYADGIRIEFDEGIIACELTY